MFSVFLFDNEQIILVSVVVNNRAQGIDLPLTINNELDLYHKGKVLRYTVFKGPDYACWQK
jgi:polyribonucleotide nucleotidyltransferase